MGHPEIQLLRLGGAEGCATREVGFGVAFFAGKFVMSLGFPHELLDAF
jgi:hypothetical protein